MADVPSTDFNKKIADQADVAKEIDALDAELAQLRNLYEQYFLGLERKPPEAQHKDVRKRIDRLKMSFVRQTALKFRINSLQSKYLSYDRLWARTKLEIENGTYKRDLFKAKMHAKDRDDAKPPPPPPEAVAQGKNGAPAKGAAAAAAPGGKPAAPGAKPAAPAPAAASGPLSEAYMKAVFNAYVTAKKRCNEDTSKLSYDQMASTLRKQVPELMKQHNAKSVEFKVVIKDGKAVLRAVPK